MNEAVTNVDYFISEILRQCESLARFGKVEDAERIRDSVKPMVRYPLPALPSREG